MKLLVAAVTATLALAPLAPAHAAMPAMYKSCANLNKVHAHGIGAKTAVDEVAPGARRVTSFRRDNAGFLKAMSFNKGLDRDKDKIACEKR